MSWCTLGRHRWVALGEFTHPLIRQRHPTLRIVVCSGCGKQMLQDGNHRFEFEEVIKRMRATSWCEVDE